MANISVCKSLQEYWKIQAIANVSTGKDSLSKYQGYMKSRSMNFMQKYKRLFATSGYCLKKLAREFKLIKFI